MARISKEELWARMKPSSGNDSKTAGEEQPSLPSSRADDPEQKEGGRCTETAQLKEPEAKESASLVLSVAEPSATVEPNNTRAETEMISPQQAAPEAVIEIGGEKKKLVDEVPQEKAVAEDKVRDFCLDQAAPLSPESFPNTATGGNRIPTTIPNLDHMLASYGINVRYNVIKKKLQVNVPGLVGAPDNLENSALSQVVSLATLNTMSFGQIPSFLEAIGNRRPYNPVVDWIKSKPWDGVDRLEPFCDTLIQREDFPDPLKCCLIERWLISAVAAAFEPSCFHSRGVLTIVGAQSIGKTRWLASVVPNNNLREGLIKLDHHLDAGNKDTVITAVSHWIVEIGELDSSFKRDVARLKGFITADSDKLRRPYGKGDSEYPRRTVFCASVNDEQFLVDMTGNTRWWTIPVVEVNYKHDIDMQQLWHQIFLKYEKGEQWWLTKDEENLLENYNKHHIVVNAVAEKVLLILDLSRKDDEGLPAMTATEVLQKAGYDNPTNPQQKDCNAVLRRELGPPKRIRGYNKWRVPIAKGPSFPGLPDDDFY